MPAFEVAYARWYRGVVRSAWSICRDLAVAEELAQEAFVKAYGRWSRLERGGYAEPWVHRTVMNLALSDVRRRKRGRELEHVSATRPSAASTSERLPDELIELLRSLPRRQREAVFLRVVVDLDEAAVASLMGCTAGSVKTHKKRGLDRLRDVYEGGRHVADAPATAAIDR